MRVIFGIGNPGNKYQKNRHNVGFMLLDQFAEKHSLSFIPSRGSYYYCEGNLGDSAFSLVKPTTYVNNSGLAIIELIDSYSLSLDDLLIIHDDINLETAKIKIKFSGSDGGHNGLSSIIYNLTSDRFPRLRVGIGKSFKKGDMASYVLSDFSNSEFDALNSSFEQGITLIEAFISGGTKEMLDVNSKLNRDEKNSGKKHDELD